MKWFGRKAGGQTPRPPLARAFSNWSGSWSGGGEWPQGYEAQMRAAVLANPVAQRALRLVSEAAGSAVLTTRADNSEDAAAALALVQTRAAGQGLVESLACHILLNGNGYVQIAMGRTGGRQASFRCAPTAFQSSLTRRAGRAHIAIGPATGS